MDVEAALQKINQTLAQYSFGSQPEELYLPMHYILGLDQKRRCPLLTFWGCYMFSGKTTKALMPSLGVEVFYNFLLLHEDIIDQNPTRNGLDSVQVKWNDNVAILSGDAMIFKSYELMIQVDQKLIKPVIRRFNQCFTSVCEGKQLLLNLQNAPRVNDHYLEILQLKPGALAEFSLQLGALIGGATQEQCDQAGRLGNSLGVMWGLREVNSESATVSLLNKQQKDIREQLEQMDCDEGRKSKFWDHLSLS